MTATFIAAGLEVFHMPDAAEELQIAVADLRDLCRRAIIPHRRAGTRTYLLLRSDIDDARRLFPHGFPSLRGRDAFTRILANAYELNGGLTGDEFVYFVQGEDGGPIKIGRAENPVWRVAGLQVGNPKRLIIIGCINGCATIETIIHREFRRIRLNGEWFKSSKSLRAFMSRVLAEYGVSAEIYNPVAGR